MRCYLWQQQQVLRSVAASRRRSSRIAHLMSGQGAVDGKYFASFFLQGSDVDIYTRPPPLTHPKFNVGISQMKLGTEGGAFERKKFRKPDSCIPPNIEPRGGWESWEAPAGGLRNIFRHLSSVCSKSCFQPEIPRCCRCLAASLRARPNDSCINVVLLL